jgi:predicted O-methyltransferase YrrM
MLDNTALKLDAMYEAYPQLGWDGLYHELDKNAKIDRPEGQFLAALHQQVRPNVSIEVGMGYGFSTLFMLDAMHAGGYGYHIAIDPFQMSYFKGIGLKSIEELDFTLRFRHIPKFSIAALNELFEAGVRSEFVFIDGWHTFDAALIDFFGADRLLINGGVIVFDDMWMPALKKVASFIRKNCENYVEIPTPIENVFCIRKNSPDRRNWDHFVDF